MKKLISMMLGAAMLLTLASGCASNSDTPAASQGTTTAATASPAANGELLPAPTLVPSTSLPAPLSRPTGP